MLFFLFVAICMFIMYPNLMIPVFLPLFVVLMCMLFTAIKYKIKTGYFFPWEHREELEKKGITKW